jgi:uncharacterized coiled-coil protein SlyX
MAVPWLVVGQLVLGNLDKIIGVVKPAFTRRRADSPGQLDLLNQQIAELQAASATNAEQVDQLAQQLKEIVAAIAQSATEAQAQRAAAKRHAWIALSIAVAAFAVALAAWFIR